MHRSSWTCLVLLVEYQIEENQRLHPWSLTVRLDEKPLSANKMFNIKRHRTHAYNSFAKRWAEVLVNHTLPEDIEDHSTMWFSVDIKVGLSSPLADLDNCLKPTIDCLQEGLGFNDKKILELHAYRNAVSKGSEYVEVTLTQTFKDAQQCTKPMST